MFVPCFKSMPACLTGVSKIFFYGIVFGLIELVPLESVLLEMCTLWNTSGWQEEALLHIKEELLVPEHR